MRSEESLNRITQLLKVWKSDLDAETFRYIYEALMNAKKTNEINEIILSNIQFIDRYGLWRLANKAKKRINNLNKVKRELTEIIYKN